MSTELATLISQSLRTLLNETMFHANAAGGFILNRGEPGMVDTLKALSAETVCTRPSTGRKPIVSHANHVLFGWDLLNRAIQGEEGVFEAANWDEAWKLERVSDAEWQMLLAKLEKVGREILEHAPQNQHWNEMMLTGIYASAAHTAYHLGAIRQMLLDLKR
jgi:hypothetical protein